MGKVLFAPLNTNHVTIFHSIAKWLNCEHVVLCHDRISDSFQYRTENLLKPLGIPYMHFPTEMQRSPNDGFGAKVKAFFEMKRQVRDVLGDVRPEVLVLAIDNDPIAQVLIREAKRRRIRTALVQEALIRPHELGGGHKYLSDHLYAALRFFGLCLNYTEYASGGCDRILVGGRIAFDILKKRGFSPERMRIVGLPRYDDFLMKVKERQTSIGNGRRYLFAASTLLLKDEPNRRFLKLLVGAAKDLGIHLTVKLHPRMPEGPEDVRNVIGSGWGDHLEVLKGGDDTFALLEKSEGLVTVSSTVVLEALMMGKECVVANYLAGVSRLEYGSYDAVHVVEAEEEIPAAMRASSVSPKSTENKRKLLEDELFTLDGRSGERAARRIEELA